MKALMDDYSGLGTPDDKKEQKITPLPGLAEALESLDRLVHCISWSSNARGITDILSPEAIRQFCYHGIIYEGEEEFSDAFGFTLDGLIRNSYAAGYNDFTLDTTPFNEPLNFLGHGLKGGDTRLRLTIDGPGGRYAGMQAKNIDITVNGKTGGLCGQQSENCTFDLRGDVRNKCAGAAKDSTFTFHGSYGLSLAPGVNVMWHKEYTRDCTFRVFTRKQYNDLPGNYLPENTIVLLDEDEKEISKTKIRRKLW